MEKKKGDGPLKVLIADKGFIIGLDLTRSLIEQGYEVFYKSDIKEMKQLIATCKPDFILAELPTLKELFGKLIVQGVVQESKGLAIMHTKEEEVKFFTEPLFAEAIVKHLSDRVKDFI